MHSHSGPVKQIIQSQCIVIKLPPDSTTEPTRRDLTLNNLSSPFDPQRCRGPLVERGKAGDKYREETGQETVSGERE